MSDPKSILVIDDEEIVRKCAKRSLAPAGYEVTATGDAAEGLALLKERPFDLVITDFKMPKLDGFQVMQNINSIRPGTKVVIITGYIAEGTLETAMASGALSCLEKPFTPSGLLSTVTSAIGPAR